MKGEENRKERKVREERDGEGGKESEAKGGKRSGDKGDGREGNEEKWKERMLKKTWLEKSQP